MPVDRRRYSRVNTGLPVTIEDFGGRRWPGKSMNLSLGGLKVESNAPLEPGDRVRLRFTLPDGELEPSAVSMTIRKDSNGLVFAFVGLERPAFDRIRSFVNYLLPRQPLKVLVVEDDQSVAEVFSDFIRDEGHEALVAESAEAGLQLMERFYPDAMVVDLCLPGMSGVELLRLLADQGRLLPCVALSGVASAEEARESLRLGALDFISKPVGPQRLLAMLNLFELQVAAWRLFNAPSTA